MENGAGLPVIRRIYVADLRDVLNKGIQDFARAPQYGLFFGGFYAAGGIALTVGVFVVGNLWLVYPLAIGFALIGPFIASGLYDISRCLEGRQELSWSGILGGIWRQHRRELGWMAFVMLFIFWTWMYQIRTLIAVFFGSSGFASFEGFLMAVFTTPEGLTFLAVGHLIGALISLIVFALTAISCPMMLDRDVDIVTAMITSIKAITQSPIVMLAWGIFVIVAILLSALPAFIGLIFVLPILGHATWHLYRKVVIWPSAAMVSPGE